MKEYGSSNSSPSGLPDRFLERRISHTDTFGSFHLISPSFFSGQTCSFNRCFVALTRKMCRRKTGDHPGAHGKGLCNSHEVRPRTRNHGFLPGNLFCVLSYFTSCVPFLQQFCTIKSICEKRPAVTWWSKPLTLRSLVLQRSLLGWIYLTAYETVLGTPVKLLILVLKFLPLCLLYSFPSTVLVSDQLTLTSHSKGIYQPSSH